MEEDRLRQEEIGEEKEEEVVLYKKKRKKKEKESKKRGREGGRGVRVKGEAEGLFASVA